MDLIPDQVSQDSLSWSVWYQSDFKWNHSLPSLSPKRSLHWPWRNLPCPLIGKLYVIAISNQCTFKLVTNDYRWVIYRQAVVEREKHGDQSAFNLTSLSSRNSTLTEQVFNQAVDKCPKVQSVSITSPGISDTQLYRQLTNQGFIQIIFHKPFQTFSTCLMEKGTIWSLIWTVSIQAAYLCRKI